MKSEMKDRWLAVLTRLVLHRHDEGQNNKRLISLSLDEISLY